MRRVAARLLRPGSPVRSAAALVVDRLVVPLSGGAPPGLRRGTGMPPGDHPVLLVVLLGGDEADVERLLATVRQAQLAHGRFTPVFVLDTLAWGPVRRAGYALEHLPGGAAEAPWRMRELRRTYDTGAVLVVAAAGTGALSVGHVLGAAPEGRGGGPLRRLARRLEAWVDPGTR